MTLQNSAKIRNMWTKTTEISQMFTKLSTSITFWKERDSKKIFLIQQKKPVCVLSSSDAEDELKQKVCPAELKQIWKTPDTNKK